MPHRLKTQTALQSCSLIAAVYAAFENPSVHSVYKGPGKGIATKDYVWHKIQKLLYIHPLGPLSPLELIGLVTETDDTYRITLRGTDSFADWADDARIALIPAASFGGRVTAGIDDLAHQIFKQIMLDTPRSKKIILSGHSLGAAVITRLATLMERADEIYPIASPKFAEALFAAKYQQQFAEKTYRYVNTADAVPELPENLPSLIALHHVCPTIEFRDSTGDLKQRHAIDTYAQNIERMA